MSRRITSPPKSGPDKGNASRRRTFEIYKTILCQCRVFVGNNIYTEGISVPTWAYSISELADKLAHYRERSGQGINLVFLTRPVLVDGDKEPLTPREKVMLKNCFFGRQGGFREMPLFSSRSGDQSTSPAGTLSHHCD